MQFSIRRKALIYFVVLAGVVAAWSRHVHRFSVVPEALAASEAARGSYEQNSGNADSLNRAVIGGQKVVLLSRKATLGPSEPEFLSATILPGRGMNLFQITANIPTKGIVQIFASPELEEAAPLLNDGPDDSHGVKSFSFGGAFLVPYPNRIRGKLSADGQNIVTHWKGRTLTLPAVWKGKANPHAELHAIHGLILDRKTDSLEVKNLPDGQMVKGIIHAGDFGGRWLSNTDLTITIVLKAKSLEASITAKNVGTEQEPMGIGWHPYFAIPSGDRKQARLHIPAADLAEVNNYDDVFPTGRLTPVAGSKYDFQAPGGKALGDLFLDDNFSHLTRTAGNVVVDLTDPAANYGIHIEGLSKEIRTIQVYSPQDRPLAAIEEQFNYADPFSPIWKGMDTGMVTLHPGQSVNWTVRLVLFTPH
jgi:galactose mutarotase-like enzyme